MKFLKVFFSLLFVMNVCCSIINSSGEDTLGDIVSTAPEPIVSDVVAPLPLDGAQVPSLDNQPEITQLTPGKIERMSPMADISDTVVESQSIPMLNSMNQPQLMNEPKKEFSSRRRLRGVASIKQDEPKTLADALDQETIDFTFDNTELEEMVRRYTEKKHINVIFPPTGLKEKITFKPPHKLTMKEAKRYLYMFLDYAGYAVLPGQNFVVVAKSKEAQRSQLPLFVLGAGSKLTYKDLADSDEMIRSVYYLSTLKVENTQDNAVMALLRELLTSPDNVFIDTTLNGIIISDKARVVKAAIHLLSDLDATESKYIITTIQLFNAAASSVAALIKDQILAINRQGGGFGQDDKQTGASGSYFSTSIRVVADPRRNLLIIMGKEAPVNRLKDFIRESLDAPLETGKSLFHVYDLKYLDAATFADTLASVVKTTSSTDQVSAERAGGATRFFEGVSIKAETYQAAEGPKGGEQLISGSAGGGTVYRGGNRLLIAAQPSDWQQIKKLIDQLDIPQRQVIIEVLIADYTRTRDKDVSTHIRSPHAIVPTNGGGAFQTSNDGGTIIPTPACTLTGASNPCPFGTNIYGDLMRTLTASPPSTSELSNLIGYSALTFTDNTGIINDGAQRGIWGLISMLDQYGKLKILQHPYLISLNNTAATVTSQEIRRGTGDIPSASGGALNVNVVDIPATLTVTLTPRIASLERINLDIVIDISNYTSTSGYDRNTRQVKTNVNMAGKNQILVLGGLTRFDEEDDIEQTPLLGKIPLIGWLFKGKFKKRVETELGVFIRPTVIEPKIRDTANAFTKTKIEGGAQGLYDDTKDKADQRDPIIRWFFKAEKTDNDVVREFLTETGLQQVATEKVEAKIEAKAEAVSQAKTAKEVKISKK